MKKIFALFVCLIMVINITGCSKGRNTSTAESITSENEAQQTEAGEDSAATGSQTVSSDISAASTTSGQETASTTKADENPPESDSDGGSTTSSATRTTIASPDVDPPVNYLWERDAQRAAKLGKNFINGFYNSDYYLLFQYGDKGNLATAWEYIGLMGMQDKLAMLDSSQTSLLNDVLYGLDYYGAQRDGKFFAYVVNRSSLLLGAADTAYAYDDNAWISIELTRAYEITGNAAYLRRAEDIMNMLIDQAWFTPLGGFRWDYRNEPARTSCTTNETVREFLDLYKYTGNGAYLDWAKKVYDWMDSHLRNKDLNIYYNQVWATQEGDQWVEGSVDKAYYSYNTGTAISAAASLYGVTHDQRYLDDAKALAKGAYDYFGNKNVRSGYVDYLTASSGTGNVWFSTILLSGFVDLYPYDPANTMPYIQAFQDGIDYGYDKFYSEGMMPRDWLKGWSNDDDNPWALDQSSNAQIYAQLALFYKQYAGTAPV